MLLRVGGAAVAAMWVVLGMEVAPGVEVLGDEVQRLLASIAATGTLALCVRCVQRPVEEVFDAGREYERRVMLREMNRPAKVYAMRQDPGA